MRELSYTFKGIETVFRKSKFLILHKTLPEIIHYTVIFSGQVKMKTLCEICHGNALFIHFTLYSTVEKKT